MTLPGLPPPKPIPLKERAAMVFVERAQIDVKDGAFVAIDADGMRTHIPVGGIACLMLEPGARISHAAVALAAQAGTLVTWVGEGGVRLYSAGQPGGARSDKLLWQRLGLWTMKRVCVWCGPCSRAVLARSRPRAVRSSSCAGSRGSGSGTGTSCWRASSGSSGKPPL